MTFKTTAAGTPPLVFQWSFNGAPVEFGTNSSLTLTNLQPADIGGYSVVVMNGAGAATSAVARLQLVSGFTFVADSALTKTTGNPIGAAWADFNNDGWVDLFTDAFQGASGYFIFTNKGGTLASAPASIFGPGQGGRAGTAWADYDNDGLLDLAVCAASGPRVFVYHAETNGKFTLLTNAVFLVSGFQTFGCSWADYDNDGFVDLFVTVGSGGAKNLVFHNNRDGTFTKGAKTSLAQDNAVGQTVAWGDYDNDGKPDLFAANLGGGKSILYHNDGGGKFTKIATGPVVADGGNAGGAVWGDFDNDGDLDLFVTSFGGQNASFYRNDGGAGFVRVTNDVVVLDGGSAGCIAVDFDNDGWLDLVSAASKNLLYHNNGDGTFTKVTADPLVARTYATAGNNSVSSADVNHDGYQDLVLVDFAGRNQLFMNKGDSNAWLTCRLEGRTSNRSAIGAKVRMRAVIGGREIWQMREISGGGLYFAQNELSAAFGLGDATQADLVRIEWPSGIVQEMPNVAARQFLSVTEPNGAVSPATQEALPGAEASFSFATTLPPPLTLQWRLNGLPLEGETNMTLVIPKMRAQDAGAYSVMVKASETGGTFETAKVFLSGPVVITRPPDAKNARLGAKVTFDVSATGIAPLTFQWRLNGADILNATNSSLVVTNVESSGVYDVVVANAFGPVQSPPATLALLINPAFLQQPLGQSVVAGGTLTLSAALTGSPAPFTFEWRRGTVGLWTNVVTEPLSFLTLTNVQPGQAGTYRVVVKNAANGAAGITSADAIVKVLADSDGDGLPDEWEVAQGLSPADPGDAAFDSDADGMSNREEFLAGTNPRDGQSYLRVETLSLTNSTAWVLRFMAASNLTYTVESSLQAAGSPWLRENDVPAAPANRLVEITTPNAMSNLSRFFRLVTPRVAP